MSRILFTGGGGLVSLALQQVSRGVCSWGGLLLGGSAWSGGWSAPGPSVVSSVLAFCYGLLVWWPSRMVFWGWQKATTPEGHNSGLVETPPSHTPSPHPDGYCCRRYASYWNAFLLHFRFRPIFWDTEA